jgi:hypothetical protein
VDDGGRQILERAPIGQPVGESSRRRPHPRTGLGRRRPAATQLRPAGSASWLPAPRTGHAERRNETTQPVENAPSCRGVCRARGAEPVGALLGPPPLEQQPDLAQMIVKDRPAAVVAERLEQLAHPLPGNPRISLQKPSDLVLERIELRRPRRTLIARRALTPQRTPNRVAVMAVRLTISWIDRPSTSFIRLISAQRRTPSTALPPRPITRSDEAQHHTGRTTNPSARGCDFNRPRRVSIQTAPTNGCRWPLERVGLGDLDAATEETAVAGPRP